MEEEIFTVSCLMNEFGQNVLILRCIKYNGKLNDIKLNKIYVVKNINYRNY